MKPEISFFNKTCVLQNFRASFFLLEIYRQNSYSVFSTVGTKTFKDFFILTFSVRTGPTDEVFVEISLIPSLLNEMRSLPGLELPSIVGSWAFILFTKNKIILIDWTIISFFERNEHFSEPPAFLAYETFRVSGTWWNLRACIFQNLPRSVQIKIFIPVSNIHEPGDRAEEES